VNWSIKARTKTPRGRLAALVFRHAQIEPLPTRTNG
jgi:hypothetical protein